MSTPEEEYTNELKDCKDLMKRSEKIGVLKSKDKDLMVAMFFESKRLIYTLLYLQVETQHVRRIVQFKNNLKNILILKDLRLVIKMVNHPRYTGQGIPLYDLILHGIQGYIYALDVKFDPSKGFKLSTYATWWIKQHAQRAIEYNSKLVRLPNHIYSEISKVNMVVREYTKNYSGEAPNAEEIAARIKEKYNLDWTIEHIEELGRLRLTHTSLDHESSNDDDETATTLIDFMSNSGENEIIEEVERAANKEYVSSLLDKLTHQEQKLINWKYGFLDMNTKRSAKELQKIMGMSQKEYSLFEAATMARLRELSVREKCNLD